MCAEAKPRKPWKKCICGYLYYDWSKRPFGVLVPVLRNDKMVKCGGEQ